VSDRKNHQPKEREMKKSEVILLACSFVMGCIVCALVG
jgi:hypothetical protein